MEAEYLHIWPRGEFMLIALPNQDKSWTVTLFMSHQKFKEIQSAEQLLEFFKQYFPDALKLIGEDRLIKDFFMYESSNLLSVKVCFITELILALKNLSFSCLFVCLWSFSL